MSSKLKMPILLFGSLAMFFLLGYSFRYLINAPMGIIDHVYLIAGALGVWLFLMNFSTIFGRSDHSRKLSKMENMISDIGILEIMVLLMTSMLLLAMPPSIEGISPEATANIQRSVFYIFVFNGIFAIYALVCMNIWSKYEVAEEHLVLMGSKVLYPGEQYRMWPFVNYKDKVIKAESLVKTEAVELRCKNDMVTAKFASFMKINIEEAKKREITNLDLENLSQEAKNSLVDLIKNQASSINVSQLLKGELISKKLDIAGVPIIWEGRIQASTV